ncbi:hypothetical protein Forpe1208_v014956 [Fusarium oxysporum f. sp. rapae]|uniref:Uncharacterized protein n=1 Tax=Fusarium oxysporum f. sp. rapae TaxID=485398 RepID=A0A8J5NKX4_FUSOX|nr:hypothetical protein Forpe1208_v014956 [Fusarium oxysporum f. sp. rapae]
MKRYRKILPKPTPPESKPDIEDDVRSRGSQGELRQPLLLSDTQSLSEIQGQIDIVNARVRYLKLMLEGREEAMQRCNPEDTKRAMEYFAYSRCGIRNALSMADSSVIELARAIIEAGNDHAPRALHQLLDMCKLHQARL